MTLRRSRLLPALLLAFLAIPASALASDDVPAPTTVTEDRLVWDLQVDAVETAIELRGPEGVVARRVFQAGEVPAFTAADIAALDLPDGEYRYDVLIVTTEADADDPEARVGLTQSGPFAIRSGRFVAVIGPVITGNQTIRDSLCVGFDCADSESYGFETLMLKENNTRIRFFDTSAQGGFSSRDWWLVANSSQNGGASYFAIQDAGDDGSIANDILRVAGGAPARSLWIDEQGDLALGTESGAATTEIHVADGDTPTLRLEQDGSSGFATRTWDLAGNETNFFVRDVNNGSALPLRILAGSPGNQVLVGPSGVEVNKQTNSGSPKAGYGFFANGVAGADRMLVGFDDVTTAALNTDLEVEGLARFRANTRTDGTALFFGGADFRSGIIGRGTLAFQADYSTTTPYVFQIRNTATATNLFRLDNGGNLTISGALFQASDVDRKDAVVAVDAEAVLEGVVGLPLSTWQYTGSDVTHLGPMAQDFYRAFGLGQGETTISMVDADGVALAAIQALHTRNEAAQARIAQLEAANAALAERLARIEALLGPTHE
ncbi:tail fiber domain-containing protein [Rubrivirga marina]|uniref:Peptidase S74 domain-containing protein n=1 Tax=Rubrivirga marina TaxID=1196024 RepID=A0A271J0E8_9BACT|nr:tail fiber domain-containing protein [Rubrivirga marina]PAP76933.1 hypothetical protein BSZ37_11070 [Rubrivirga marina]